MDYKEKVIALLKSQELSKEQKEKLENIFPELKESEDEKVRKALAEMVHDTTGDELWVDYNVHKEEALAWLEKQGEKKSQRMISAEAKEAMYDKPAWSEENELVIKDIEEAITNYWHGQSQEYLLDRLKSLKQRIGW